MTFTQLSKAKGLRIKHPPKKPAFKLFNLLYSKKNLNQNVKCNCLPSEGSFEEEGKIDFNYEDQNEDEEEVFYNEIFSDYEQYELEYAGQSEFEEYESDDENTNSETSEFNNSTTDFEFSSDWYIDKDQKTLIEETPKFAQNEDIPSVGNTDKVIKDLEIKGSQYAVKVHTMYNDLSQQLPSAVPQIQEIHQLYLTFYNVFTYTIHLLQKLYKISSEAREDLKSVNSKLDDALFKIDVLTVENQNLKQAALITNQLLEETRKKQQEKEKEAARKKQQRLKRQKKPLRDVVDSQQFLSILEQVKGDNSYTIARDKTGLLLLKLFGWRIGQLRIITIGQIKDLSLGKTIFLEIIKARSSVKMKIAPSKNVVKWLKKIQAELNILFKESPDEEPLFRTSREHLTRRLNKILKIHSLQNSKNIRSHSFRVTTITNTIEHSGIEKAREIAGHSNISATQIYNRFSLNTNAQKDILDAINPLDSEELK